MVPNLAGPPRNLKRNASGTNADDDDADDDVIPKKCKKLFAW